MNKQLIIKLVPLYLIIGLFFALPTLVNEVSFWYENWQGNPLVQRVTAETLEVESRPVADLGSEATLENPVYPTKLEISRLNVNTNLIPGGIVNDQWVLDKQHAFFVNYSQNLAVNSGNAVIYGHNIWQIFLNTQYLKPGDILKLTDSEGVVHLYKYEKYKIVPPSDVSVFTEDGPFQLVLITCNGWTSEDRKLMYFKPVQ